MVSWHEDRRRQSQVWRDPRLEMIDQTSAFLSWALEAERELPEIPRARVDEGGFTLFMHQAGARALVETWWERMLSVPWPGE